MATCLHIYLSNLIFPSFRANTVCPSSCAFLSPRVLSVPHIQYKCSVNFGGWMKAWTNNPAHCNNREDETQSFRAGLEPSNLKVLCSALSPLIPPSTTVSHPYAPSKDATSVIFSNLLPAPHPGPTQSLSSPSYPFSFSSGRLMGSSCERKNRSPMCKRPGLYLPSFVICSVISLTF